MRPLLGKMTAGPGRWRELVAVVAWVLAGSCWVAVAFVPWAESGHLSRSTLVELAGLARSGVLTSVPGWLPALTVVLPLLGAALIALALLPIWWWIRPALLVVAVLLWWAMTREVVGADVDRWAAGPWLGVAATGLGVIALVCAPRGARSGRVAPGVTGEASRLLPTQARDPRGNS